MAGNTFIQVPNDITSPIILKRFLGKLILELDKAFGNRGQVSFASNKDLNKFLVSLNTQIEEIVIEGKTYTKLDGSRPNTGIQTYSDSFVFTNANDLITKVYVDTEITTLTNYIGTEITTLTEYVDTEIVTLTSYVDTEITTLTEYIDTNFTNNPIQASIASLAITVSNPPNQAEVQAIADKVDDILVKLRDSNIIA